MRDRDPDLAPAERDRGVDFAFEDRDERGPDLEPDERELEADFELDERRRVFARELREPPEAFERRSDAGTSSLTTALVSTGICLARKLAIRSSSRRIERASFAVSRSPTDSASASIAV